MRLDNPLPEHDLNKNGSDEFNVFTFRPFLRIRALSILDIYDEHATSFC
jgi:hypothetical protein